MSLIDGVFLSGQRDTVVWELEKSGEYSTKSMYRWLTFGGVSDPQLKKIWKLKMPTKIKIFVWQVIYDRSPTREQILIRHGPTLGKCPLCDDLETLDHLLFICPVAVFVWSVIREAVEWPDIPCSILDLISVGRASQKGRFERIWIGAAAVLWSLWTIRNDLIFEGITLKHPADAVFRVISLLQLWRPLWDEDLREYFGEVIQRCKRKLRHLRRLRP